jgi:hypothetical protein
MRYKVKTRPASWPGELFIGANVLGICANEFGTS